METRVYEPASAPASIDTDPVAKVLHVHPAISWKAIFAGGFIGILAYLLLSTLGVALGAIGLEQAIEAGEGGMALSIGAGVWLILSVLVSLFVAGYFGARASGIIPTRIGAIEGLVIASLFFVVVLTSLGAGLTAVGRGAGSLAGSVAGGAANVAGSPQVQSVVSGTLENLNLRSDPSTVAQGVATRLVRGDENGAVSYLAGQAGISQSEARQRLEGIKNQVASTAQSIGQGAAQAAMVTGWVLFGMILLGSAASLFGGVLGARRNIKHPVTERDRKVALEARSEWATPVVREEPVARTT